MMTFEFLKNLFQRLPPQFALLGLLALAACAPKAEYDCGYVQNSYGERVSWKASAPVTLKLHESVPADLVPAILAAAETWNKDAGHKLISIDTNRLTGSIDPKKDGRNIIYYMNTWEADRPSEQARTSIYWLGDQILEADMRINAKNFTFYASSSTRTGAVNIEALVLHEMGHVLGLKHKDEGGSVMATYLSSHDDRVKLAETDFSSLQCEY